MHYGNRVLPLQMTLKEAAVMFENAERDALAVVDGPETKHVMGLLSQQNALCRYSEDLARRRREPSGE